MKDQKNTPFMKISKLFLSFFGVGFFPKAPGTCGSIATIPLIILLRKANIDLMSLIAIIAILTLVASLLAEYIQKKLSLHDPQWIVMDEVIGMLVCWSFIFPSVNFPALLAVLLIFRVFDIIKIWPASYFDQKVTHGFGTIIDDIISGIMAGLLVLTLKYFTLIN